MKVFLIGFMGSGKSTVGKVSAKKLGLKFLDLDSFIEEQEGKSIREIFSFYGEEKFRLLEKEALAKVSAFEDDLLIATGGGCPCFFDNMELMNQIGLTVYLKISLGRLVSRLKNGMDERPLLNEVSDLYEFISAKLEEREPFYSKAQLILVDDQAGKDKAWKSISKAI